MERQRRRAGNRHLGRSRTVSPEKQLGGFGLGPFDGGQGARVSILQRSPLLMFSDQVVRRVAVPGRSQFEVVEAIPENLFREPIDYLLADHYRQRIICKHLDHIALDPGTDEVAIGLGLGSAAILYGIYRQRLFNPLPIALPEMMLGINQTIMMALSMLVITALVGTRDLGQEVYIALTKADTGRGLVAGVCVALIAIIADRLISAGARHRKRELGIAV